MKLVRNNDTGIGKYAIWNLRKNMVEWGRVGDPDEFFLIKLKDKHARAALLAYAESAAKDDPEYAAEIRALADRAGEKSPFCKQPD